MATLTFHGAARQVTGSCYLVDTGESPVLLECGMFQGAPETERLNERAFPFDPRALAGRPSRSDGKPGITYDRVFRREPESNIERAPREWSM